MNLMERFPVGTIGHYWIRYNGDGFSGISELWACETYTSKFVLAYSCISPGFMWAYTGRWMAHIHCEWLRSWATENIFCAFSLMRHMLPVTSNTFYNNNHFSIMKTFIFLLYNLYPSFKCHLSKLIIILWKNNPALLTIIARGKKGHTVICIPSQNVFGLIQTQ